MGFCRRCGDIVTGPRCTCGGLPVAPVVQWNQGDSKKLATDRWSRTYTSREGTAQPRLPKSPSSTKPFRGLSMSVSNHITSTTSSRPASPLKYSPSLDEDTSVATSILPIPTGGPSQLAKVYGSVLQSRESLESYQCHACATPFPPDATLYPDPSSTLGSRFFCRACFVCNGGSRGDCATCHRAVLILKSEGGFVENGGRVWHKRCFSCSGCGKLIGDNPMVDLLGRPSCAICFETCLMRNDDSPKPRRFSAPLRQEMSSPGGSRVEAYDREGSPVLEELQQRLGIRSREATPIPATEIAAPLPRHLTEPPDVIGSSESGFDVPTRNEPSPLTPVKHSQYHPRYLHDPTRITSSPTSSISGFSLSPKPTSKEIEQMKQRFLRRDAPSPSASKGSSSTPTPRTLDLTSETSPALLIIDQHSPDRDVDPQSSGLVESLQQTVHPQDVTTSYPGDLRMPIPGGLNSSSPSPPMLEPGPASFDESKYTQSAKQSPLTSAVEGENQLQEHGRNSTRFVSQRSFPRSEGSTATPQSSVPIHTKCAKCSLPLFNLKSGGRYVTVPESTATGSISRMYHITCFRCRICDGVFEEKERGQAVFVRGVQGACHLDCAPSEKTTIHRGRNAKPVLTIPTPKDMSRPLSSSPPNSYTSSRYSAPLRSGSPTKPMRTRFGSSTSCPGCQQAVSAMERGVVHGPQGTRWHSSCLICGGREFRGRNGRRKDGQPGCGKQLDSSAKTDRDERRVWCRECLLLVPNVPQVQNIATSNRIDGNTVFPRITPQVATPTTTIARQFTGLSGKTDGAIARQTTGGGLGPTRQLSVSPTRGLVRQHTGGSIISGPHIRPRPKSVIGTRDEARGMFLVRQLTGGAL